MNYRNSLLALAVASTVSVAPSAYAIELGEFNDTTFSIGGYFKAEAIYEKVDDGDSRIFGRSNQSRVNLKTVTEKQGHTIVGFVESDFMAAHIPVKITTFVCAMPSSRLIKQR